MLSNLYCYKKIYIKIILKGIILKETIKLCKFLKHKISKLIEIVENK